MHPFRGLMAVTGQTILVTEAGRFPFGGGGGGGGIVREVVVVRKSHIWGVGGRSAATLEAEWSCYGWNDGLRRGSCRGCEDYSSSSCSWRGSHSCAYRYVQSLTLEDVCLFGGLLQSQRGRCDRMEV